MPRARGDGSDLQGSRGLWLKARQRSAFPPNYIHSIDSTHMMMTALECSQHGESGEKRRGVYCTQGCVSVFGRGGCNRRFLRLEWSGCVGTVLPSLKPNRRAFTQPNRRLGTPDTKKHQQLLRLRQHSDQNPNSSWQHAGPLPDMHDVAATEPPTTHHTNPRRCDLCWCSRQLLDACWHRPPYEQCAQGQVCRAAPAQGVWVGLEGIRMVV